MGFTLEEKKKIRESNDNFEEKYKKYISEWLKFGKYTPEEIEELAYATFVLSKVGLTPEQYGIIYNMNSN